MVAKVTYKLEVEQDDTSVRGNASASGDPALDKELEGGILKRLEAWDVWAWALVKVEAKFAGFTGVAYLGCCSYESEADFRADACFEDLKEEALEDLERNLESAVAAGEIAAKVLADLKQVAGK